MLDVGGSHGLFSLEYVKKYPGLKATILDLPLAVDNAEPLLRQHYQGDKIHYIKGNALTDSFGEEKFDLILIASVMHHFTAEQNMLVSQKVHTALKKNGYFVIHEFLRAEENHKTDMISSVMDLFFNLSSSSGGWTGQELINFQQSAGLVHLHIKKFWSVPGLVQVIAQKK
jgi:ubiquinone/menaquinone biosynthesis C-methylase UbiE